MTAEAKRVIDEFMKKARGPATVEVAEVASVSESNNTCVVRISDGTMVPDVRLKAGVDGVSDGLVQIPAVGSSVLVALIGGNTSMRFVVAFSSVTKIVLFGGDNGPLPIWDNKLKTELDKVKEILDAVKTIVDGAPIAEPGSGSPSAFQAALKSALTGKTIPSFEDLTDTKVTH